MDATLFVIGLLISCIPYGLHLTVLRHRHDFVSLFNAVLTMNRKFAGMYSDLNDYKNSLMKRLWVLALHLGTCDVRYLTPSPAFKAFCTLGGVWFACLPFVVLFILVPLRWSPIMVPYHVFGGNEALMKLEREGSMWYWSVFALDWAIMTAGALAAACILAIFYDTLQNVNLIMRAMR